MDPEAAGSADRQFLDLVFARQGHFRLESGHHGRLWFDLDGLFVEPDRVRPLVARLADALRGRDLAAICGPLVGGAFLAQMLASALQVDFLFTERAMPAEREALYGARYGLPRAVRDGVGGKRVAIVDDVISAGSAVRGTFAALQARGAQVPVIGALCLLGSSPVRFFAEYGVPVASVAQLPYDLWLPRECPLCAAGQPLEDVAVPAPEQE
jgi:orotate phosphoribosyltransferase